MNFPLTHAFKAEVTTHDLWRTGRPGFVTYSSKPTEAAARRELGAEGFSIISIKPVLLTNLGGEVDAK